MYHFGSTDGADGPVALRARLPLVRPAGALRGGATGDDSEGVKKGAQTQRTGIVQTKWIRKRQGQAAPQGASG